MGRKALPLLYLLSLLGLFCSAIVHVLSYFKLSASELFSQTSVLGIVVFIVFGSGIYFSGHAISDWSGENETGNAFSNFLKIIPLWVRVLFILSAGYVFINFFYSVFVLAEGGVPSERDGIYVIHNHGHIIRELTEQEFYEQQAYQDRISSGHWILFYLASAIMLYLGISQRHECKSTSSQKEISQISSILPSNTDNFKHSTFQKYAVLWLKIFTSFCIFNALLFPFLLTYYGESYLTFSILLPFAHCGIIWVIIIGSGLYKFIAGKTYTDSDSLYIKEHHPDIWRRLHPWGDFSHNSIASISFIRGKYDDNSDDILNRIKFSHKTYSILTLWTFFLVPAIWFLNIFMVFVINYIFGKKI